MVQTKHKYNNVFYKVQKWRKLMQRSNRRVLLTKMLLKEALLKLLQSKSIETINVSELCREADVNRATFYRHYNTPNDVLLDIGKELSDGMNRLVKRPSTVREAEEYVEKIWHIREFRICHIQNIG